jgi:ribosomal protein S26
MERGRVRKGSGSVLFLFQCCNDVPNDNQMTSQMTTDYNENKSVDNLHKMDVMGRH